MLVSITMKPFITQLLEKNYTIVVTWISRGLIYKMCYFLDFVTVI